MKLYLILFLIISIGIIAYSNSLGNAFIWDDELFVITNDFIKDLKFTPLYFTSQHALAKGGLAGENYRPLLPLSYALDYSLWKLNPMGYHITNLLFHIINSLLVFYLVLLITKNRFIGFFSSLIFLTHPVQTEAVSWISGRADVLFLLFFLSAFISYIKYRKTGRSLLYPLSLLFFSFALLSKEMAATLPFVLILYDRLYTKKEKAVPGTAKYLPFFLLLALYISIRFVVIGKFSQCAWWTGAFYTTFLTMLKGFAYYIKLLLYPAGLCADYLTFPIATSIKDPAVISSLGLIVCLIGLSLLLRKKSRDISFSILWFFITLAPVMNIIPIKILIAERFLYLPLIGYAMALAVLFNFFYVNFRKRPVLKYAIILCQAALIFTYSFLTVNRNTVWADEIVFNKDIIEKYPDNYRAYNNLSIAYMRREEDLGKAYEQATKAVELAPDFHRAKILLAGYLAQMGRLEDAINELNYVLERKPDSIPAHMRLASIYIVQEKYEDAYGEYEKVLAWDDSNLEAKINIATLYEIKGEKELSAEEYEKILAREPGYHQRPFYAAACLRLGDLYASSGEKALAYSLWARVYEDFPEQTLFSEISRLLTGDLTLDELLSETEMWPQEFKTMSFYYIGVKKELEGDTKEAGVYYEKCRNVPTETMDLVKILAKQRLKNMKVPPRH